MKSSGVTALALLAAIGAQIPAQASPRTTKVYAANGRRVAVIKDSNFGRRVYDERGRRVATIKTH